jgi:single-strand DNA-binding protein
MLMNVNGVVRLVADCEIKFSNEKSQLIEARVATNQRVKNGDQWEERPSYVTVKSWLPKSSKLPTYLKKGTQIYISGDLFEERWESEGQKRSKLVVEANAIELIGGKSTSQGAAAPAQSTPVQSAPAEEPAGAPVDEDDLPF